MNLSINMVLIETATQELFRVIGFTEKRNEVIVISITRINSLPVFRLTSDLIQGLSDGTYQEHIDTSINFGLLEYTKKQINHYEEIWSIIGDFVKNEPECFNPKIRSEFIKDAALKNQTYRATIQRYLYRYWANGKSKNALIPKYYKGGGKGKSHTSNTKKLGRPVLYPNENHRLNITAQDDKNIHTIINKYYNKNSKYSLKFAYERYIEEFYTEHINDRTCGSFLKDAYPTRAQFDNHAKKYINDEKRFGSKIYNKDMRGITGSSASEVIGPGSKYQLDATVADVYLVSEFDTKQLIGRPVLYFITDVFSRMIVGFYVGVEGPSWTGAMMALYNTFSSKVKLCALYGISITEAEWPCEGLPEQLMVDNGEMVSKASDSVIEGLGVDIQNASAWRPDMKGIVENSFHLLNVSTKSLIPGAVYPDFTQRGGRDYRLDAKLTIKDFTKTIIIYILHHNSCPISKLPCQDDDIISAKIENTPLSLWNWGIANRTGRLRQVSDEKLKLALMLKDTARVTERGIKFKNLFYSCSKAIEENWFSESRRKSSWMCNIAYDPRNMDNIYLLLDNEQYEECSRTDANKNNFIEWSFEDICYYQSYISYINSGQANKVLESKIDYKQKLSEIVNEAEERSKITDISPFGKVNIKNTKASRKNEKEGTRKNECFGLQRNLLNPIAQRIPDYEDLDTDYNDKIIMLKLKERNK